MDRPTWLERFAFRTVGWKLGPHLRPWVVDDVRSGRATWWRIAMIVVMVGGMQVLVRWGTMRRLGEPLDDLASTAVGSLIGIGIGVAAIALFARSRLTTSLLRVQGLRADGSPDPSPSRTARLDNYQVGAVLALTVAFVAAATGLLPRLLVPTACEKPSAIAVEHLGNQLRPGATVTNMYRVHKELVTAHTGVVRDARGGALATWLSYPDGHLIPMNEAARLATPSIGTITNTGGVNDVVVRESQACASRASRSGGGRTVTVLPVRSEGPFRIDGAAKGTYEGSAGCGPSSATFSVTLIDGRGLSIVVSPPLVTMDLTDGNGVAGSFSGRAASIDGGVVRFAATVWSERLSEQLTLRGEVPCS